MDVGMPNVRIGHFSSSDGREVRTHVCVRELYVRVGACGAQCPKIDGAGHRPAKPPHCRNNICMHSIRFRQSRINYKSQQKRMFCFKMYCFQTLFNLLWTTITKKYLFRVVVEVFSQRWRHQCQNQFCFYWIALKSYPSLITLETNYEKDFTNNKNKYFAL